MKKTYNRLNRILSIILVCVMISQTCFSSVIYGADLESGNISAENNVVDETTESTEQSSETDGQEQQEQVQEPEQSEPESEQTGETSEEAEELYADNTEDTAVPSEAEELFTDEASELTSDEADAGKLTLAENEKQELTLTEDKTFTEIELSQGSELTVNTNNHSFTVNGDITGNGKVTLKGKNIRISNLSVSALVIEEAEVTAGDSGENNMGKIQAADSLTVRNSKISNAAFLGYGEDVSGEKTLAFEGSNELQNITQIGTTENGNAIVLLTGISSISTVSNSNFCCDYKFTYSSGDKVLTPEENWPVSYRVKYTGNMSVSNGTVCGFHKAGSDGNADASYQSAQEITLPSYAEEGYIYNGWIIGDETETITAISGSRAGEMNLKVSMTAAKVVLTTDLGYTPAADTNDDYDKIQKQTTTETSWGESVSLTEPTRFGYQFDGWKVIKGLEDENNDAAIYKESYQAALKDAEKTESGSYTIFLQAQWSAKNFSFRFFIKDVDSSQMQVKTGTETYGSVQEFAEKHSNITWNENSSQLEFPDIKYNETIREYISRVGLPEIPVLEDTRTGDQKQEFRGWTTPGGKKVTDDMKFAIGEILDNRSASVTLTEYEKNIHSTPVFLTSAWGTSEYALNVEPAPGWELLVNEEVQELDKTKVTELNVSAGSKIAFRCSALNPENFSLWDFTEGFLPEETAYTAGAKYLSYETVMPSNDVTASYSNDLSKAYIDIAQGSVIFEQDVELPSGRKADGFWYPAVMNGITYKDSTGSEIRINAMTPIFRQNENSSEHAGEYFYIWDSKNAFRITTQQNETTNQLILANTINVYLRDCNMTATEAYKQKAVGTKFDGVELESLVGANTGDKIAASLSGKSFRECGNIVADTAQNSHYDIVFYVEGDENSIANITTDRFHARSEYGGSIKIQSSDNNKKSIRLGTVFGDFSINMQNLNVSPYENGFEYLIYTAYTGAPYINSCIINAEEKSIFTFARRIQIVGSSKVEIGELKCYYEGVKFGGTSYTHVHRDIYSNRHGVVMSDNASAVIDGNVITTAQDNYSSGSIDTTGYLIVKGTVFDASNLTMKKGTVICNVFQAGESFTLSGSSVLIANMITSNIYNRVDYDADSKSYQPSAGGTTNIETLTPESEISNEDDYPFAVYGGNIQSEKVFTFEGNAKVYLLGHYKTREGKAERKYYDLSVKATDGDNPVSKYIAECLDENGDLKSSIAVNIDESAMKNTDSSRECIVLGNSLYTAQSSMPRSVKIKGAEIYADGNITFFNDTAVTGGTIVCQGSFGSKLDLTISGGDIKANTVGNVYDLTSVKSDKTKTWKKTSVTGGKVQADVIGARESYGTKGTVQRSLVEISGGTIKENSTVRSDEYINYIYDTSVFPEDQNQFAALQDNIRFTGNYEDGKIKNWTTEGISDIAKPKMSDGKEGEWSYDSLAGRNITGISKDGTILPNGDNEDSISVQGKDCLRLYAVKKQYTLTRVYGDSYYNISARNQGETAAANWITGTVTDLNDLNELNVSQATVDTGAEITLEITANNSDYYQARTVVWYIDANGQYHNALNGHEWENKKITFPMPKGNCYIYVVDDEHTLPLDLNAGGLSFTNDGFITEFADPDANGNLSVQNEDTLFTYAGNYRIVQSNIGVNEIKDAGNKDYPMLAVNDVKKTENRIIFASDFDNTADGGQKITVSRVFQKCQDAEFGTLLENNSTLKSGAKVQMQLDGNAAFFRFQIKENSSLTLEGKNGLDKSGVPNDTIYITKGISNSPDTYLTLAGNNNGKTGDLTLEKLNVDMLNGYSGFIMRAMNDKDKSGSLTMRSCKIKKSWGDSTGLARNIDTVTLENCDIDITTNVGYTTAMFLGCKNVTICKNSKVQWKNIGSTNTGGFSADYGISDTLTVDDSEIITAFEPKANEGTYLINPSSVNQAKKVVLQNNASYTADSLAYFNGLQVSSGAKLNIKQQTNGSEETWLFCKDILVDGGNITADNVILSGFYEHKIYDKSAAYKAALDSAISNKTDMVDGNSSIGLKITSGSVNASKFVGGDCNGKIEVSGGVLQASAVGTSGYLYGFIRQLPGNKIDYAYRYPILDYSNYTESATVTVKDSGTVQISENGYLGGMRCKVEIQGGNVILGNHSILGMTEEQKEDLEDYYSSRGDDIRKHTDTNCKVTASGGSIELKTAAESETGEGDIRVPYGAIEFSGTAKAKVTNILSENGTIQISKTAEGYENPYQGGESSSFKKVTVAIWVLNTLSAQTLEITDGAQVYAENAYAVVEQTDDGRYAGELKVCEAGLYAASYGEKGVSRENNEKNYNDKSNDPSQTVFGTRLVTVTYVLNPQGIISDDDLETVVNESPENYTVTAEEKKIDLENAQCRGYRFCGWYSTSDCTGDKAESLNTSIANDLKLYAKWEKIKVKFQVMMDKDSSGYYAETEFAGNKNWTKGDDSYVSAKSVELAYGEKILSVSGVNLMDYITNTLGITELEIKEAGYAGNKVINADSIVSRDLAEYYKEKAGEDSSAVIILHVKNVQKRIASVTFDVNRKEGKPADAAFADGKTSMQANISVDREIGSVAGFGSADSELVKPSATGYTFIGWNTDKNAGKDAAGGWVTSTDTFKADTTVYAIWQANTYLVQFDAGDGNWVTVGNTEPGVSAEAVKSLSYYWVYDTPVSENQSFWLKLNGTDEYMTEMPYAWREGYVFDHSKGWTYTYTENGENKKGVIESTEELSKIAVSALDTALGDSNGNPTQVALTITASYTPVEVTYELNGGKWQKEDLADEVIPEYGKALAGYVKADSSSTDSTGTDEVKTTESTGADGTSYYVASTTNEYYSENKKYVSNDYRHVLQRKGYTFYGWYTSQNDAEKAIEVENVPSSIGTTPRFQNVTLYAAWKANTYTLKVNNKDVEKTYSYTEFKIPSTASLSDEITENGVSYVEISATTGQEIEDDKWPSRESNKAWYIHNSGETENANTSRRYFLGATFMALDPGFASSVEGADGKDIYDSYAKALTTMENNGTLYMGKTGKADGTVLTFPEDSDYRKDLEGVSDASKYTIPDYPEGSTIDMYAVYREQSIVFIERYVDKNGNEQQKIMHTASWDERSDYPNTYGTGDTKITSGGYTLIGWYVNSTTANEADRYPADAETYKNNLNSYIRKAAANNTYDIMVYTVYTPQIERKITLDAKQDPTSTAVSSDSYTLPASMQTGILHMELSGEDLSALKFVSKEQMQAHQYDQTWKDGNEEYTSDNTVAVQVTVSSSGKLDTVKELSGYAGGKLSFEDLQVGSGDQITLTLYHSRVMTQEKTYSFTLKTCFTDNVFGANSLENQYVSNLVTVNLKPSLYKVNYTIQLPEELDKLTIQKKEDNSENWGDFTRPEETGTDPVTSVIEQKTAGYGSSLLKDLPAVEGYTPDTGWKVSGDQETDSSAEVTRYTELKMLVNETNKGVINLSAGYTVQSYDLSADGNVLDHWKITYSDETDASQTDKSKWNELKQDDSGSDSTVSAKVNYHSVITFEPRDKNKVDPSEFVTLKMMNTEAGADIVQKTVKLPDYAAAGQDDTYSFVMPAMNVAGSYITTETMYLDEGTISITEQGYTQNKSDREVHKIWRGNYTILQNAENDAAKATENRLLLSGDLSGREISLGNLNISSTDSVELQTGDSSAMPKAVLTFRDNSTVTAKNIKVPSGAELSIVGTVQTQDETDNISEINGTVKLSPGKTTSAIGGTQDMADSGNGKITLNNIKLELSMPAGSEASAIGPAKRNSENSGDISLSSCEVTVAEGSATETYKGAWIGGDNTEKVTLKGTSLQAKNDNHMTGPVITTGKNVTAEDCQIGTVGKNVTDPVYAAEQLDIKDSSIYINIQDNISTQTASAPIGTCINGTTKISNSTIKAAKSGGTAQIAGLYSGTMKIQDVASNVMIDGTQILEVSNGAIHINGNQYQQDEKEQISDTSRKNYVLLEENAEDKPLITAPDLTVTAVADNGTIEIRQPSGTSVQKVTIGNLQVQTNTTMILNGNLNVTGTAILRTTDSDTLTAEKSAITLNVEAKNENGVAGSENRYGITFSENAENPVFLKSAGNHYIQSGGKLECENCDFSDGSLNVTLNQVSASVKNLYAKNLTVDGGTVESDGKVGSKPENGSEATSVKISKASVTAAKIGALGVYDQTFTSVTLENPTLNGNLVQDHYRLKYDTGRRKDLDTESLNHVFRTETTYGETGSSNTSVITGPENGIPGNPDSGTETDKDLFGIWYINGKGNNETDTAVTVRKALAMADTKLPAGLKERTVLSAETLAQVNVNDVITNGDGTKTLTVHAWLNASGTAAITKGRVFQVFDSISDSISVQKNGTWTAMLTSTGTSIEGRDYKIVFNTVLPKGTTLTLTEPSADSKAGNYYYYKVTQDNISSVKFTEFTAMGGTEKFKTVTETDNIPENETFLLSVDFGNAEGTAASDRLTAEFKLIPSDDSSSTDEISMGETLTYSLTDVNVGVISASEKTVTIEKLPLDADKLAGKNLFMKAVIKKQNSNDSTIPYGISASWNGKTGTWISRDTVLFELGSYSGAEEMQQPSGNVKFEGLENGTYQISYSLVYGTDKEAVTNIAGNMVSSAAESTYTEDHIKPSLKVTPDTDSRMIRSGTETKETFTYEKTSSAKVTITAEKQDGLCEFNTIASDPGLTINSDPAADKAEITFGKSIAPGTYRICFSIDESSSEDNVYITFIVK